MPHSDKTPEERGTASRTTEKDKILLRDKLRYGSGIFGFQIGNNAVQELAYPIYNIFLGMPASLIGLVLTISRFWDAFTDPVMGSVSDNARTRWGRRKPFILLGAVLCTITYASIWMVPEGLGQWPTFIYLLVTALLFFTSFTIFAVPYTSQGFELTPDYHERTRLMAVRAYFAKGAAVIIPWVFALTHWDFFSSQMSAVKVLGVVVGLLIILSALPTLFVKERFEQVAAGQLKMPLWKGIRETLQNKPFLFLVGLTVATQTTVLAIGALGLYVSIYYVFGGDTAMGAAYRGYAGTMLVLITVISIPLVSYLSGRYGKIRVMKWILITSCFSDLTKWFIYTPEHPNLQLLLPLLAGPTNAGFWVLVNSMKADIPDHDEIQTGLRREGMFGAMSTWIQKIGMSLSFIATGFILDGIGFDPAKGGAQDESTLLQMRIAFVVVPAVGNILSLIFLRYYPLNETRMCEIRKELENRRGKI